MIKYFSIAAMLVSIVLIGEGALKNSVAYATASGNQQTKSQKAPAFTLYDINGNQVKLSDYAGKIVILDFWATWCPPCRKGIPDLISIQSKYKDDVMVIGISLDDGRTQGDVLPFIQSYGINYPVVIGTMDVVYAYGNISAIPTSFIIDQSGNIIKTFVGLVPKKMIEDEIDALLGET